MILTGLYILFVFVVTAAAVWLYRILFAHRDTEQDLVTHADAHTQMTIKAQQGFITLGARKRQGAVTNFRQYASAGETRVPWGW